MHAIEVDGLTKRFAGTAAVEDVTFTVATGEVFGFLGPNGAGKTTTVRMLTSLIRPTAGSAKVAGVPVSDGRRLRHHIGVMPEAAGLYDALTVVDNLAFFGELHGLAGGRLTERVDRSLAAVGLTDRRGDRAGTLSKGLRQRAALARTLLAEPKVLFLDEPTAGLDPEASADFRDLVAELRGAGVTIFLTTHRLEEAARLCDRVAILSTRLITVGSPDEMGRAEDTIVEIRTRGAADTSVLTDLEGVRGVEARGSVVRFRVDDVDARVPDVVRALVGSGADVTAVREVSRSLEETYLELVGRRRP